MKRFIKTTKQLLTVGAAAVLVSMQGLCSIPVYADEPLIPAEAFAYNGHYYAIYDDLGDMDTNSWDTARRLCEARGGHLATITDAAEDEAVFNGLTYAGFDSVFFGLYFNGDTWCWVTEEAVDYLNWGDGEPNGDGNEPYAMYFYAYPEGQWNDGSYGTESTAYLCEWDSGILASEATIFDEKNNPQLPDNALEFEGHRYVIYEQGMTARDAESFCIQQSGHLVFIESQEEQDFLLSALGSYGHKNMYWIGARENSEHIWTWQSGSTSAAMEYGSWSSGEPDNPDGESVYAVLNLTDRFTYGGWVAESNIGAEYRESNYYPNYGFICEWEISCYSPEGNFIFHSPKPGKILTHPNCTEAGYGEYVCERCGEFINQRTIPARGHSYLDEMLWDTFLFNPVPGIHKLVCTRCGDISYQYDAMILILDGFAIAVLIIILVAYHNAKRDYKKH